MDALLIAQPAQLLGMAVEALEFGEKADVVGKPIENADGVGGIEGGDETIAGIPDRLHVPRRDVTGSADEGEVA
jgi:hypothetical protein